MIAIKTDPCANDNIYVGFEVTLLCTPPAAYPSPQISWLLNGRQLQKSGSLIFTDSNRTLTISSITTNQTGQWMCQAQNEAGLRESQPSQIIVQSESGVGCEGVRTLIIKIK